MTIEAHVSLLFIISSVNFSVKCIMYTFTTLFNFPKLPNSKWNLVCILLRYYRINYSVLRDPARVNHDAMRKVLCLEFCSTGDVSNLFGLATYIIRSMFYSPK
jgi:hypothetical protein